MRSQLILGASSHVDQAGEPAHRERGNAELLIDAVEPRHTRLLCELFEDNTRTSVADTFDPFPASAEQATRIAREPRKDPYHVAVARGRPVAMAMLRGFDEGYGIPSFGIFVARPHHGQGIGRLLTERTIAEAQRIGCEAVRLSVYAGNPMAVRMYRSLGSVEQSREQIERAGGQRERIVMILRLNVPG
jgi:ribosomal protein S18 acetylase RimI-like enzyme